jgi:outer membrane protein assembly factor BamB
VRSLVQYVPTTPSSDKALPEIFEPSVLVVPRVGGPASLPPAGERVVLALSRGVLYALDKNDGHVRWATRVGIDTTALPVRLPQTITSPELFLVVSADRNLIIARVAQTGELRWQHRLSDACLGRPVVVGQRVYVPTYDGRVHEIETVEGKLLGHFELGQPLTVGGVWQENTDLLYFPGDSEHIYVLDIAQSLFAGQPARKKQCAAILHTGHPSGSLRSEPMLINRIDPLQRQVTGQDYLILSQTDGLDHMKLRVFGLPIEGSDSPPLLQPDPRVRGWSWFRPYFDSEKLAFVTDAGVFGLFGINQVGNVDRAIFPEFQEEANLVEGAASLGRAQVVHASENDFWVVANGELQKLHFDLFGQKRIPLWTAPLPLGSPLHTSQYDEATKTIVVVTRNLVRQIDLVTAVGADDGKIRWQRQLGLEVQGDPVVMGQEILVADRGGGLFRFQSGKEVALPGREWRLADALLGTPLELGSQAPYLIPAADGISAYEIAYSDRKRQLTIRHYQVGKDAQNHLLEEKTVDVTAPPAAPPALGEQSLLLLLADGVIQRFALPLDGTAGSGGPNWRTTGRADDGAQGFVVQVSNDEFLTTDGSRGITHWQWPLNGTFRTIPEGNPPTVELSARIVSPPIVLPRKKPTDELQVCVADADGNVILLKGRELQPQLVWTPGPGSKITSGPFLRGDWIGCIVDRQRLVWIDPTKDKILWQFSMPGDGIVGQPQILGNLLVVADLSGRFIALDPATGRRQGMGYTLKASAAPVATPVAFGPDTAFVPLTDGTIFLLNLRLLIDPFAAVPFFHL